MTEGDSAKALAVAGLSVVGRDKYGVFPLKGKMLNVRDANYKQVTNNQELSDLKAKYVEAERQAIEPDNIVENFLRLMTSSMIPARLSHSTHRTS